MAQDPLSAELYRLNSQLDRFDLLNREVPGAISANRIHGVQVELQSLINSNLVKPNPNFPPR